MKQYRLLRNNKETGPHTGEELIRLGFKKYDLIWAEGKSAAWRYPGELEEFKAYAPVIEEQPFDRFYKKPAASVKPKKEVAFAEAADSVLVISKKEKPRIKIKADCKKIELVEPLHKKEPEKAKQFEKNTPEWKDIWLDWEQEKKAVSNVSYEKNNSPALEIKYEQPLSEIKERYAETLLKPRNKASFSNNNFIVAAILITAILGTGIWMGFKWSSSSSIPKEQALQLNVEPEPVNTALSSENEQINSNAISNSDAEITPAQENFQDNIKVTPAIQRNTNPDKQQAVATKKVPVSSNISPVQQTAAKSNIAKTKIVAKDNLLTSNPATTTTDNNKLSEKTAKTETEDISNLFRKPAKEPKIKDYISVETYTPSQTEAAGIKYRVQNISDIPVDMVMIDLQYYDALGHYQKGETVYVRNIASGQTVTVQAPDNTKAAKINYKISMVSAETKSLYLIAD